MSSTNEGKMRYGTSALDLSYKKYAVKDELLVDGKNGKMFYKREDGQVVTYDDVDYTSETLEKAMSSAINKKSAIVKPSTDYIVYHKIDIEGRTDVMTDTVDKELNSNVKFHVSPTESGMFIRVRGNSSTISVMKYLEALHDSKNPGNDDNFVVVTLSVKEVGTTTTTSLVEVTGSFNELIYIPLESKVTGTTDFEVTVKSVKFPLASTVYATLSTPVQNFVKELNYGNDKFECTSIDVVTYVNDISNQDLFTNPDEARLMLLMPMSETKMSSNDAGIVVSKDKPTYECVWGKIIEK